MTDGPSLSDLSRWETDGGAPERDLPKGRPKADIRSAQVSLPVLVAPERHEALMDVANAAANDA
jgi:hypothetical protein